LPLLPPLLDLVVFVFFCHFAASTHPSTLPIGAYKEWAKSCLNPLPERSRHRVLLVVSTMDYLACKDGVLVSTMLSNGYIHIISKASLFYSIYYYSDIISFTRFL
jgi:hypothetical protein